MQIKVFKSKLPIIIQSSYAKEFENDELMRINFDGFLSKPFNRDELLEIIKEPLNK